MHIRAMKKEKSQDNIGRFFRATTEEKLKQDMKSSDIIFMAQYSGLSSVQMTSLRNSLRLVKSRVFVTKNTLINRALKSSNIEGVSQFVKGPTAVIFSCEDISAISKSLVKFAKENPALSLNGAFFGNRILEKKDIESIAALPSKDELRAQVVMSIKSPLAGLVFTLQGALNKLVIVLNQIKDKKS